MPEFGSSAPPAPWERGGAVGWSPLGGRMNERQAAGLPAVTRAIRLKAETMAAMELGFYRTDPTTGLDVEVAPDQAWQVELFDTGPSMDNTEFDWVSDIGASVEGYGNGFALKTTARGRRGRREVVELIPLDADYVRIRRKDGDKVFDVHIDGRTRTVPATDVFHIRGFTLSGALSGLSPAMQHAAALGYAIALEEFSGRYFANDTSVGLVMEVPGNLSVRQAQRQLAIWELSRGGTRNAHRPAIVYNGTKLNRIGVGLRDAQYIEAQQWTVQQVARIYGVPAELLEIDSAVAAGTARLSNEQLGLRFLTYGLFPSIRRFEAALRADPDLRLRADGLRPKFDTRALLRVDARTAAEVEHYEIQDGTLMRDEARADRGLPPLPPIPDDPTQEPGKVPLLTPVGAGPNPTPTGSSDGTRPVGD